MIELLLGEPSRAFAVALCLVAGLALLEALLLAIAGSSVATWLDGFLPDHLEVDHDVAGAHGGGGVLDWLGVGHAPLLVVLIAMLTLFGLAGLGLQAAALALGGAALPDWAAGLPALAVAAFGTRWLARRLARLLPSVETSAQSVDGLVGARAVLTLGAATAGMPAQAKLRDAHGRTHYVLVEPEDARETLTEGMPVRLTARRNAVFLARPD
ncbi:OB-fold-containig protein [Zavarzinia sp. CC-PAN008]|uniref:OB-fold-containig protein n=1 Tax=Zavarzinia sp. CC-PAN008 TaxID=3243332 RepID=UPI003F745A2D